MKKFLFLSAFLSVVAFSHEKKSPLIERQNSFGLFAGMGIHLAAASDVVNYINSIALYSQRVDQFGTAIEFFGGAEIPVSEAWGIKIEHSYLFKSYTVLASSGGTYDFFYAVNAPSVLVQKVIGGPGYFVKLGAGGGYHFGNATQTVSTYGNTTSYTARGIGVKAEIVGQTAFDENFFGYIGGIVGWEFVGTLKDGSGAALTPPGSQSSVSLKYFHAGLRFGVMYYF